MMNRIFKLAIAASAVAALPGAAHAATATATSTATLNVVSTQCSVTGANVDLGTFNSTNTWGQVAASLGTFDGTKYTVGSKGAEHLNYGSVTCENGLPYRGISPYFGKLSTLKNRHHWRKAVLLGLIAAAPWAALPITFLVAWARCRRVGPGHGLR